MKYPNSNKTYQHTATKNTSRRGMSLENDINQSCLYYLDEGLCNIHKKPTPVTIVNVDYPSRNKAKITDAYFKVPSTTDYNGIYKGKYIDFEAKECQSQTAFPFNSIHPHQIKHLSDVLRHGAIAFIIIRMVYYETDYLIRAEDFLDFYNSASRRSLPYEWIKNNGHIIEYKYLIPCDFLKTIDEIYFRSSIK